MAVQIQLRNDTAANWTSANPTLAAGEVGVETDTERIKIGDGTTAWNSLGYFEPFTHASTHESGGSDEIEIAQSQVTGLDTGTEGQVVLSDGTSGVKFETGYVLREILYITSSTTFVKADYPWLKAMRIKMVGGGGGGGGAPATGSNQFSMGSGGGGSAYAEKFISDISTLSASETVTVGAGGAGGAAGLNEGTDGGQSSFGSLISANGGLRGLSSSPSNSPRVRTAFAPVDTTTGADFFAAGVAGSYSYGSVDIFEVGGGGASFLGPSQPLGTIGFTSSSRNGANGKGFGVGGNGSGNGFNQSEVFGGDGTDGIVILELFA